MKVTTSIVAFSLMSLIGYCALSVADTIPIKLKVSQSFGAPQDSFTLTNPTFVPGGLLSWYNNYGRGRATLAIRSFSKDGVLQSPTTITSLESLPPANGMALFDFQASPDGQKIGFKYGFKEGEQSQYNLYYIDRKYQSVVSISPNLLSYKDYLWSPDGRYIAFVVGGDVQGNKDATGAPSLFVRDTATKKIVKVASSDYLGGSFTWSGAHNLYYTIAQTPDVKSKPSIAKKPTRPNLYKFQIETGQSMLLFRDCYRASISPDEKSVAFFGAESQGTSPLPPLWSKRADYMTLCVALLNGTERKALSRYKGAYPRVEWSQDETHIFAIKQTSPGPRALLNFTRWNVQSGSRASSIDLKVEDVAESAGDVELSNSEPIDQPELLPRFVVLGRPLGTDTFLVSSVQFTGLDGVLRKARSLLWSVDLHQGEVKELARAQKDNTFVSFSWSPSIIKPTPK